MKREAVNGYSLYHTERITADILKKCRRKRLQPYEPQTQPRKFSSCEVFRHFSLTCTNRNIVILPEMRRKEAVKAADNAAVDLKKDE